MRVRLSADEWWPVMVLEENPRPDEPTVEVPDDLVARLWDVQEQVMATEDVIARHILQTGQRDETTLRGWLMPPDNSEPT